MDKLLLSTVFALLAGFLTAALSFIKLVNDKESRITDYRQEWTNSIRQSLSDLVSNIRCIMDLFEDRAQRLNTCNDLDGEEGSDQALEYNKNILEKVNHEIMTVRSNIYAAYNLSRLHFKPSDPHFIEIENKVDAISILIRSVDNFLYEKEKISPVKFQVETLCSELISSSRGIIKREWETIKIGEPIYQKSKNIAKWGGVIFIFVLLVVGVHALISVYKAPASQPTVNTATSQKSALFDVESKITKDNGNVQSAQQPIINCTMSVDGVTVTPKSTSHLHSNSVKVKSEVTDTLNCKNNSTP
jgi:hypothetical protein